ncbi:MAG: choice-of-anchor D domain-containing protein, partial [Pirellulaceae bacterium]|nr:choice-of-anchor D domain-containing protein [Pirellulaceae bacterium]
VAQWVFTGLEPGFYRVSATWLENPTGATNTPYTILGGPTTETVRVNQILSPADYPNWFDYGNQPWMDLDASYQIVGDTLIVQISNDADGLVIADAIRIEQVVNPEIAVNQGATELTDGVSLVDYGQTSTGAPVTLTYTVENLGGFALDLAEPIQVPAGFSIVFAFGSTTLAPAQTTTFSVRMDAAQPGVYGGDIVFYNSDSDENPFSFRVSGLVDAQIIDDGDTGFTTVGAWTPYVGAGYQNDNTFSGAGSGGDVATWSFSGLTAGATYQVAATWVPHGNRASNAPYTVTGGAAPIVQLVNQRLAPGDLLEAGTAWEILGNVVLVGTTLQVQLSDAANGFVVADAIRVVPIVGPEIGVEVDGDSVLNNATSVDFGATLLNLPVQKTFTVTNTGTQPLTLVEPIAAPSGFLVSGFGQTVLSPNQSTTFTVTIPATTTGSFSGLVSFGTNDADENPFQFTVSGQVYVTPPPQIVDDGDSGFSTVGFWSVYPGIGHEGDVRFADPGSGATTATWSFTLPAPGTYRVSVTWAEHPNRATNAPYSVNGGPATLVNQQLTPGDFIEGGTPWLDLGNFVIAGTTLDVTLTNAANGYVIADAVRIERIASPEIRVTADGHLIHDDTGVLDLGTLVQGEQVVRQVRVRNIGTEYLVLDLPSASSGWSVSQFGQFTLAPEEWTTFNVSRDTSAPGSFSGQVSFANNDPDEATFQFAVIAEVAAAPQVRYLDDGDTGFQLTGNWTTYAGLGYQQDLRFASGGTGSSTARWTFTQLTPGGFRVATTWAAHSNRGSNVPYSVGASPPVLVNQRVAPDDFSDQGAVWEVLGDFFSAGDQLVVTMTNAANGYVVADAVRIERILDAEIQVTESGQPVRDGSAAIAFGTTPVGVPVSRTFTITNLGAQPLDLTAPVQVPPGFTASAFGQSSLHAGESTTFAITLTAASGGSFTGTASFANNDADEGLFNFELAGTVGSPPPPPQLVDDGQTGFSATSGWTRFTGVGYEGDVLYTAAGNGSRAATWTFTVPAAGDYLVSTTWVPHANRATDAPYRLYDGTVSPANLRSTTRVNQEVAPAADFVVGGIAFQDLGVVTVSGNTLTVTLANDANQYVIADAMRIEFVQPMRAEMEASSPQHAGASLIEPSEVRRLLPAAAAHWAAAGHATGAPDLLDSVNFKLVDLPGNMLGGRTSAGLLIDRDAAGWGWSVAGGGFDLLTVLAHELGHALGYADIEYDARLESQPLMVGYLAADERRIAPAPAGQTPRAGWRSVSWPSTDWPSAGGGALAEDRGPSRHDLDLAWLLDQRADDHRTALISQRLTRSPRGPAPRDVPAPRTGVVRRMELAGAAGERRETDRDVRSAGRLESDLVLRPEPVDEVLRDWLGT